MKTNKLLPVLAIIAVVPVQAFANGCIVVRPTSQLTVGLEDRHQSKAGTFESTAAYRYLFSDRHFRGTHEEKQRQAQDTQVENTIHTVDYTFTYWLNDKWRVSAGIPYSTATRSSLYEHDRVSRHTMKSEGVGDLRLMSYREFAGENGGMTLGVGIKLPTGAEDNKDIAYRPTGPEERYVDQSIQMGDGGTGLITEFQYYRQIANERNFGFFTISYLFNPEDTNGVTTYRSNPYERVQSIPDTYQLRFGWAHVFTPSWSLDSAIRAEGVPSEDLIGDSNGFRRPGYAIYFEPSLNFQSGPHRGSLSIPYAIKRNRILSVADKKTGGHGDAAFADYLVMANYTYSWE